MEPGNGPGLAIKKGCRAQLVLCSCSVEAVATIELDPQDLVQMVSSKTGTGRDNNFHMHQQASFRQS